MIVLCTLVNGTEGLYALLACSGYELPKAEGINSSDVASTPPALSVTVRVTTIRTNERTNDSTSLYSTLQYIRRVYPSPQVSDSTWPIYQDVFLYAHPQAKATGPHDLVGPR